MRASEDMYENVARRCSEFKPIEKACHCSNSTAENEELCYVSCENCNHFDRAEYCKLDLYDKIADNLK